MHTVNEEKYNYRHYAFLLYSPGQFHLFLSFKKYQFLL